MIGVPKLVYSFVLVSAEHSTACLRQTYQLYSKMSSIFGLNLFFGAGCMVISGYLLRQSRGQGRFPVRRVSCVTAGVGALTWNLRNNLKTGAPI